MTIDNQKVLKVKINKPLIGQKYNLNDFDPDALYLINRYDENAFDKLDVFPIHVYVLIPKTYTKRIPSALNDLQNIAWAMLYDNIIDAEIKKI